jgi:phosphoribosylanthranilate isomerase
MPVKMIRTITVTGADDSVTDIEEMFSLSSIYPRLEWGILVSKNNMGGPRFPSMVWLDALAEKCRFKPGVLKLSAHLCGRWVRDIFEKAETEVFEVLPMDIFERIQFNFHAQRHTVIETATKLLHDKFRRYELIFQAEDVNNTAIRIKPEGVSAYPLFDKSGGAGILPDKWPETWEYSGYAGGLSPDNVAHELMQINEARRGYPIWIDAETKLRSEDDSVFDLDKVQGFIKNAYPWTI